MNSGVIKEGRSRRRRCSKGEDGRIAEYLSIARGVGYRRTRTKADRTGEKVVVERTRSAVV